MMRRRTREDTPTLRTKSRLFGIEKKGKKRDAFLLGRNAKSVPDETDEADDVEAAEEEELPAGAAAVRRSRRSGGEERWRVDEEDDDAAVPTEEDTVGLSTIFEVYTIHSADGAEMLFVQIAREGSWRSLPERVRIAPQSDVAASSATSRAAADSPAEEREDGDDGDEEEDDDEDEGGDDGEDAD